MAVVGSAEVVIRVIADRVRADIMRALDGAAGDMDSMGEGLADRFIESFGARIRDQLAPQMREALNGALGDVAGSVGAQDIGSQIGDELSEGIRRGAANGDAGEVGSDVGNELGDGIREGAREGAAGASEDVDRELERTREPAGRHGRETGDRFSRFFRDSISRGLQGIGGSGGGFGAALQSVSGGIAGIGLRMIVLVPIIAALVAAVGALVSGLVAIGSAAALAASGGLALLPGLFLGLAATIGVAVVAFQGIGDAFSAMGEASANSAKEQLAASRQREAAERRVEAAQRRVTDTAKRLSDAEKNLGRVRRDVGRDSADAIERIADAEEDLRDALQRSRRAQEDLNDARKQAAEDLEDLQLSLRGATLGEEEAVLRLQRARKKYQETLNDNSADSMEREQARLDLQQAELALDQARDRRDDATKAAAQANKVGVEGSERVKNAVEQVRDANEGVKDAEDNLRDSREDAADQAVRGAERILEAQEAISDAQQAQADAQQDLVRAQRDLAATLAEQSASAQKLNEAMSKLSPAAQEFVTVLNGLRPLLRQLKFDIQDAFFPHLTRAIQLLTQPAAFAVFSTGLARLAHSLGVVFETFAEELVEPANLAALAGFLESFSTVLETFGRAGATFFGAFLRLGDEAGPYLERFAGYIETIAIKFSDFIDRTAGDGSLIIFFERAFEAASAFGEFTGAAFGALRDVMLAAAPAGILLLGVMTDALEGFSEFMSTAEGQQSLRQFFIDAVPSVTAISGLIGDIIGALLRLGNLPAVQQIVTILRDELIPPLEEFIGNVLTNFGPQIAMIAANIAKFLAMVSRSEALQGFFDGIVSLTTAIVEFIEQNPGMIEIIGTVIAAAIAFTAFSKALKFGRIIGGLLSPLTNFVGGIFSAGRHAQRASTFMGRLGQAVGRLRIVRGIGGLIARFGGIVVRAVTLIGRAITLGFVSNPIGLFVLGLTALVIAFTQAYKRSETFRNVVAGALSVLSSIFSGFVSAAKFAVGFVIDIFQKLYDVLFGNSIIPDLVDGITGLWEGLGDMFRAVVTTIRDVVVGVFSSIASVVGAIIGGVVTIISTGISFWVRVFQSGLSFVTGLVSTIFGGIKTVIEFVLRIVVNIFKFYFNIWRTIFTVGFTVIRTVVSFIFNGIRTVITAVLGFIIAFVTRFIRGLGVIWNFGFNVIRVVVTTVFNFVSAFIGRVFNGIRIIFTTIIDVISRVWRGLWGGIREVATTVFNAVKEKISGILGGIKGAFETAVTNIGKAWDKLTETVRKPVKAVVDVAYNKGIRGFYNKIAGVVGLPELPELRFAKGGYVPGYAPGRDTVRAILSPGEGVLVPEAVRAIARRMGTTPERAIELINSQHTSRVPGPTHRGDTSYFAGGGYVAPQLRKAQGGVRDVASSFFGGAADWVLGNLAKGSKILLDQIYKLVDAALPDNDFGNMLAQFPRKVGSSLLSFLERKDKETTEPAGAADTSGPLGTGLLKGSGFRALTQFFYAMRLPGQVTSTQRRPRFPGDKSFHIQGRAADFSVGGHGNRGYGHPGLRAIFETFSTQVGSQLTQLILAGAPFNIRRGKKVGGYSWGLPGRPGNHWNHVHVALAKGGTVLPRPGGTPAILAEAGRAESVVDTGLLNQRLADLGRARGEYAEIVVELRKQNALLQRLETRTGIQIGQINATAAPGERAADSVPRSLRRLAFELGQ